MSVKQDILKTNHSDLTFNTSVRKILDAPCCEVTGQTGQLFHYAIYQEGVPACDWKENESPGVCYCSSATWIQMSPIGASQILQAICDAAGKKSLSKADIFTIIESNRKFKR